MESKYFKPDLMNQYLFKSSGWQALVQNYFAQLHSLELSDGKETDLPTGGDQVQADRVQADRVQMEQEQII